MVNERLQVEDQSDDGAGDGPKEPPTVDSCFETFKGFLTDKRSQVFTFWKVAAPLLLLACLAQGVVMSGLGISQSEPMGTNPLVGFLAIQGMNLLFASLWSTLFRPIRTIHRQSADESITAGIVFSQVINRFLPSLGIYLVLFVILIIGFILLVVPGLIAMFFLLPATYIVAARKGPIFGSLGTSFRWVKNHWTLILALGVITGLLSGGTWWVNFTLMSTPNGIMMSQTVSGLLAVTVGFLITLISGSFMVNIEDYEESGG